MGLYGKSQPIDLIHRNDHDKRSRQTAECWLQVSTVLHETPDTVPNAFRRLNEARTPARRGKQSMKDCVIIETYIEHIRSMRDKGRTVTAVFVSSNTNDYASDNKTTVKDDIKDEFESIGLVYAPNMGAARGLLKL